jgi:hypothetical protein
VSRKWVLIKDHYLQGLAAVGTLRFMDWISNARYGVVLPYNHQTPARWDHLMAGAGLRRHEERVAFGPVSMACFVGFLDVGCTSSPA